MAEASATGPPSAEAIAVWAGVRLDDRAGARVGRVEGGRERGSEWLAIRVGRFGHRTLVPARDAVAAGGRVWVPYGVETIRAAPRQEPGEPLAPERERALHHHYAAGADA